MTFHRQDPVLGSHLNLPFLECVLGSPFIDSDMGLQEDGFPTEESPLQVLSIKLKMQVPGTQPVQSSRIVTEE